MLSIIFSCVLCKISCKKRKKKPSVFSSEGTKIFLVIGLPVILKLEMWNEHVVIVLMLLNVERAFESLSQLPYKLFGGSPRLIG